MKEVKLIVHIGPLCWLYLLVADEEGTVLNVSTARAGALVESGEISDQSLESSRFFCRSPCLQLLFLYADGP